MNKKQDEYTDELKDFDADDMNSIAFTVVRTGRILCFLICFILICIGMLISGCADTRPTTFGQGEPVDQPRGQMLQCLVYEIDNPACKDKLPIEVEVKP